jgi:hypothetical protein
VPPAHGEDVNSQITPLHGTITLNDGSQRRLAPTSGDLPPPARNLAAAYRLFLDDLRHGTRHSTTFAGAARIHRLLDNGVPWNP